ncbi:hypothetical protein D3C76_700650 [compost metagenome]
MPDVATQPDDLADLELNPHQAVGHVRYQVRAAAGKCVAERCGTALQAAQLGPGCFQRAGLVGVAVAQFLDVFPFAGDGFLLFGAVDLVVVGLNARVGVPVGLEESMLVAVGTGEGDVGQLQAARGDCLAGGHEQQPTGLDGCNGVMVPAEASEQVGVGFVGLVQVRDVDGRQRCIDQRVEAVGRGDCAEDGGQWGRIPGPFAFDLEPPTQVSAAGADAQRVRRAAVLGFVNVVATFVDQPCVVPAEPQVDCGVRA